MSIAAIVAIVIFVVMFALVITEKIERHIATLLCGAAALVFVFILAIGLTDGMQAGLDGVLKTLNVESIFTLDFWWKAPGSEAHAAHGINWETILFIAGMMVMVEGMAEAGFFRWLCMTLAKMVKFKVIPIFITFMIMSAILAMFIDSITVILFLAAVTVELAQLLKFNPVPMILAEIFCANLGGSATMCGDPPNIIIGTSLGYSFADFITNTGVIAAIGLVIIVFYFYLVFRKHLKAGIDPSEIDMEKVSTKIENKLGFTLNTVIFLLAVVLLVTHANTGLTVATIGVGIAILTLLAAPKEMGKLFKKVDYKTLLFFIGLFVVVGGLEETNVLVIIASFIETVSGGNLMVMVAIIIWVSAIASAFIDNIPFAATMIPVITALAPGNPALLAILSWSLAVGTDIGGNATPIGASANVVGMSVSAKSGHPIGWGKYCKYMMPATAIILLLGTGIIWLRYC